MFQNVHFPCNSRIILYECLWLLNYQFIFQSVLIPLVITEAVLLCICSNYMSAERSCDTHSENQIHSHLARDSVVLTNVSSKRTFPDTLNFNQTDKDQLRRKSPEVVPLRLPNVVPMEVEPHYTVSYQRDVPTNYTDLFSTDSEGNCRASSCKWPKMPGATRELVASVPEVNIINVLNKPYLTRGVISISWEPFQFCPMAIYIHCRCTCFHSKCESCKKTSIHLG